VARTLFLALALLLLVDAAAAVRVLEPVERAVELTLDRLALPAEGGNAVRFRECRSCASRSHRLLESTIFQASGQTLSLREFRHVAHGIAAKANGAERAVVVVFLDIATHRVTRIELRE
jgi:hypothetical protein